MNWIIFGWACAYCLLLFLTLTFCLRAGHYFRRGLDPLEAAKIDVLKSFRRSKERQEEQVGLNKLG